MQVNLLRMFNGRTFMDMQDKELDRHKCILIFITPKIFLQIRLDL